MAVEGKLLGSRAIVTGAAQGIGEVIAKALAREGASIAIADINLQGAKRVASEIEGMGGSALAIRVDLTRRQEVVEMVTKVLDQWRAIDILVNNAGGFTQFSPILEVTEDQWDQIFALNMKSVFLCCQAVAKHMMERRKGRIINIGSLAAVSPHPYGHSFSAYGAAKAGVVGFTKLLARELASYGITVNTVNPSTTLTPRVQKARDPQSLKRIAEMNPMGRLCEPRDSAAAVVFLASEESRYITGISLNVFGGTLMI